MSNTTAKGYGAGHQRLRRTWAVQVAAGGVDCAKCGQPIRPGQRWDLGHQPGTKAAYRGPEHATCNRSTAEERNTGDPRPTPRTKW